jgi:hypothetical protein
VQGPSSGRFWSRVGIGPRCVPRMCPMTACGIASSSFLLPLSGGRRLGSAVTSTEILRWAPSSTPMHAMLLKSPRSAAAHPLEFAGLADPSPGPDEVVLAVAACAVCRTDLQLCEGDLPARSLPIVPGHQTVGRVIQAGSKVRSFQIGDRAGVGWLSCADHTSELCLRGHENLCANVALLDGTRMGDTLLESSFARTSPSPYRRFSTISSPLRCSVAV